MREAIKRGFRIRVHLTRRTRAGSYSDRPLESDQGWGGVGPDRATGHSYDEEAFRYLLAVEHKRSERFGRSYVLVLVDLQNRPGLGARIDAAVAPELFAGLALCLRETDVVGWYLANRVAGAVLTDLGDRPPAHVCRVVSQTISSVLYEHVASDVARRLRVRVLQYPGIGSIDADLQ